MLFESTAKGVLVPLITMTLNSENIISGKLMVLLLASSDEYFVRLFSILVIFYLYFIYHVAKGEKKTNLCGI